MHDHQKILASQIKELCEWLNENGFDILTDANLKIETSLDPSEGRCLISTKEIAPNSPLIKIPAKFLVNYRCALANPKLSAFFKWYSDNKAKAIELSRVKLTRLDAILLLLVCSKLDASSFFHKFVNTMPTSYDTPEYFHPELIQLLPFHLKVTVEERLREFNAKFEAISTILRMYAHETKESLLLETEFTRDNYKWAFCSINSRCFHMKEEELCTREEIELGNRYFGSLERTEDMKKFIFESIQGLKEFSLMN